MSARSNILKRLASLPFDTMMGAANGAVKGAELYHKSVGKVASDAAGKAIDFASEHFSPGKLIRYDENGLPSGFNKKGKAVMGGMILGASGYSMANESETKHMGTFDSRIHSLTPDYSPYNQMKAPTAAPAGADGSLVFALDRTKNGGFL